MLEIEVMKTICGSAIVPADDQLDHRPSDGLGEEEGPAEIDLEDAVPALGRRFEQIEPLHGGDAGVVDPEVDPAMSQDRFVEQTTSLLQVGHVGADRRRARRSALLGFVARLDPRPARRSVVDDQRESQSASASGSRDRFPDLRRSPPRHAFDAHNRLLEMSHDPPHASMNAGPLSDASARSGRVILRRIESQDVDRKPFHA